MQHPFYLTSLALTFIFSFVLGIFTILLNPRSKVHWLWFLTTMGVSLWSGVWFTALILNLKNNAGLFLIRLLHIGALLLIIFFFHFLLEFLLKTNVYRTFLFIGYILGLFLIITMFITDLFIKGFAPRAGFELWFNIGFFYWLFILYFIFYSIVSIRFLYIEYKRSDGLRKKQIFFIFLAAIFGIGGGVTNFLPQTVNIYPFGTFVIFLYPILITYGMFLPQVKIKF